MRHISHIIQSALEVNRYQLTNAQLQDLEKRLFLNQTYENITTRNSENSENTRNQNRISQG